MLEEQRRFMNAAEQEEKGEEEVERLPPKSYLCGFE